MPDNTVDKKIASKASSDDKSESPVKVVEPEALSVALPELLTPLLLVDAQFYQYGQLLLIKLTDGRLIAVSHYFSDAPDLGLPADLALVETAVDIVSVELDVFTNYLDALAQTNPELASSVNLQISKVGEWDGVVTVANTDKQDGQPNTQDGEEKPTDAEPAEVETVDLAALELADQTDGAAPVVIAAFAPPVDAFAGTTAQDVSPGLNAVGPDASALSSLSSLSLGGLGGGGSSLGSLGGSAGSMIGTASVDGLTGVGGTSAIGGSLGSMQSTSSIGSSLGAASVNAFAPPGDAFAAAGVAAPGFRPSVHIDGTLTTSIAELNYRFALNGGGQIEITADANVGSANDFINLTDAGSWRNAYNPNGFTTFSESAGPFNAYTAARNDVFEANLVANSTFSITVTGIGTVNVNIASATTGDGVVALINANSTLSMEGVTAYWNGDANAGSGFFNTFVVADPSGRTITAASLDIDGNLTLENSLTVGNIDEVDFIVANYAPQFPGDSGQYNPDARHGADHPLITQTNIDRYSIVTGDEVDDEVAVGGANNPDFISLDSGINDYDSLSFYDPTPGQEFTGDGDFDLVTGSAYTKITNISHLEGRGYGTNFINLNQIAVQGITEEMRELIDNMDGTFTLNSDTDIWMLDISGDAGDRVDFSDANMWEYNGIVDNAAQMIDEINLTNGMPTGNTITIDSTRDQFGNIQYQFQAINGIETYYVNVSADILDHPDWFWSGGTAGNDAYELPDTQFGSVDFGAGEDTLELNSGLVSKAQDFTGEGGDLANVEIINLTNTQSGNATATIDTATVDRTFVTGATDSNNMLSVIGDSVDSVVVSDIATDWTFLGSVAGTGGLTGFAFNQYAYRPGEASAVTLNVETELAGGIDDYYRGWEGDDVLTVFDNGYAGIDGDAGTDSIRVNAASQVYTSALAPIANIEIIDGAGHTGATAFTVSEAFVDLQGGTLTFLGDSGSDTVALSDMANWSWAGQVSVFGVTAFQYQSLDGSATLNVQSNLASTPGIFFNGTTGDDTFTAPDLNFISLDGAAGTDWLEVTTDNYDFTAAGIAAKIDNLEVIDARAHSGASTVTLNLASVGAMTDADNKIHVLGDAADTVVISDLNTNWSYIAHVDGIDDFTGMRFYQYQSLDGTHVINIFDGILGQPDVRVLGDIGGASNDILVVENLSFSLVDGLTGTDTLQVEQAGVLDFTALGASINNMEAIDLTGVATSATLSADFVLAATDANNKLVIQGDNSDSFSFTDNGSWNYMGVIDASGPWSDLHVYQGTAGGGEDVFLYQETNLGSVVVNATGTAGDDLFRFANKEDTNLDGGLGTDTLTIAAHAGTQTVNFSSGTVVTGIEILDLRNSGTEDVTFDLASVSRSDNNAVFVLGDAGQDMIDVTNAGQWSLISRATFTDAPDMYVYGGSGGQTLYVQTDLIQDLYQVAGSTAGDDVFQVIDTNFGALNGGGGAFDRINFLQDGGIDLANLGGSSLNSVEVADLTNGVANNLSLTAASIELAASSDQFYVLGEVGDSLTLAAGDNWQFQDSLVVSSSLTLDSYTSTATGGTTVYVDSQVTTSVA